MSTATAQKPDIRSIPIGKVVPAKDNPRSSVGDVAELVTSIKAHGILEPLLVTMNGSKDSFVIVAGERRHSAAKKAGLTEIPAIVLEGLSDKDRREIMMIENLQREDLSTLDEARGYKQLLDDGMSQRELAPRVGKSQSHISKRVALLGLPEAAFKQVDSGDLTLDEAASLKKLSDLPSGYMTKALKETARGDDPKRVVTMVQRDYANDQKVAKIKADLKKKGIKTVDIPRYGNSKGAARRIGSGYYELNTTVDKHKDESCHAVGIEVGWNEVKEIPVCTSPARHAPNGASKLKAKVKGESGSRTSSTKPDPEREKAAKAREREAARRQTQYDRAEKERRAFIRTMLEQVPDPHDVFTLLLVRSVTTDGGAFCNLRDVLVDLGLKSRQAANSMTEEKAVEATCVFAVSKKANLSRVALALIVNEIESELPSKYEIAREKAGESRLKEFGDYFEVLERHGYEPAPIELELLGRATADEEVAK